MLTLNTGAPQGCVLNPVLYSLFTQDCVVTMEVGLITDSDEAAYREEVGDLAVWCQDNNLSLNFSKTNELIVHYKEK